MTIVEIEHEPLVRKHLHTSDFDLNIMLKQPEYMIIFEHDLCDLCKDTLYCQGCCFKVDSDGIFSTVCMTV
uniref:C1_2 domain-containing protein n=1 Tax=Steinernema glaseri TaxID=37863 RepID=A0A1I8AN07_9BILA